MNRERQNEIVKLLNSQQTVKNSELMERFDISIETVRRDLAYLENQGVLKRVYGGAVKKNFLNMEPDYINRQKENLKEKIEIAVKAESLLDANDNVFFDVGTTVLAVAQNLDTSKNISAYTNSLRLAMELSEKGCGVTITGGRVRYGEFSVSGFIAEQSMKQFNFDKAIIGAAGVDENGITDFNPEEANLRRQVVDASRRIVVVADSSKLGLRTTCNVCTIDKIDVLVTDKNAPKDVLKRIEKSGVEIILV